MKKLIIFLLITFSFNSIVSAQNKPVKGISGLGINYKFSTNVNFPVFKYDYYLTNSWVLTATYQPGFVSTSTNFENNGFTNKSTQSSYSQSIGLGIEKHFFDKYKIDPFVGFSIIHGLNTKTKSTSTRENIDQFGNQIYSKDLRIIPMVNSLNLALNVGLNYFILDNFSVGMQLDLGNGFGFVDGKQTNYSLNKVTDSQGQIIQENETTDILKINTFNSDFYYNVAIKTAFYFPLKKKEK